MPRIAPPARRLVLALAVLLAASLAVPAAAAPKPSDQASDRARAATAQPAASSAEDVDARVVVAVVDSGINPYHEFFRTGASAVTPAVLEEFGIGEDQIITLSDGDTFAEAYEADRAEFEAIERGTPYWFEGTNIIGISFRGEDARHLDPTTQTSGTHGIGVTASVLTGNPEAIVVVVDGINDESERWAFRHPAIDAVSTSYGTPVGEPDVRGGFGNLTASYEGVVTNGKHHFGAVANAPTPSPVDPTGGPWWTIGVAGYQEGGSEGRQLISGSLSDFVGDFTQTIPYCRGCLEGTSTVSGTSFATPLSAGTFSAALLEARRAAGHVGGIVTEGVERPLMVAGPDVALTNWEFRRALEEAAIYPGTSDYSVGGGPFDVTSAPAVDAAPWSTFGWGVITPDPDAGVVAEVLAHLGVGGEPERGKDARTCDAMTLQFELRQTYWDDVEPGSDSAGQDDDPYLRC